MSVKVLKIKITQEILKIIVCVKMDIIVFNHYLIFAKGVLKNVKFVKINITVKNVRIMKCPLPFVSVSRVII